MLKARKMKKKKDVCSVIRVDKEKKNIDLSKKWINSDASKEVELKYVKGWKI